MEGEVQLELMRPEEIVAARAKAPVVFVPMGPLEWHGPHLPMGTDGLVAHYVATEVARSVGGVVLPALFVGTDRVREAGPGPQSLWALGVEGDERVIGMDLPGFPVKSVYIEEWVFGLLTREVIRQLKRDEYRVIVLVSGHGAPNHLEVLRRLAREESDLPKWRVELVRTGGDQEGDVRGRGHADRWETSCMLKVGAGLVRKEALPPVGIALRYREYGIVDGGAFAGEPGPDFCVPEEADPRGASAEEGERLLVEAIRRIERRVKRLLEEVGYSAEGRPG